VFYGSNKRTTERKDFPLPCLVWIDRRDGSGLLACAIEDVSKGGAKLRLAAKDLPLPNAFILRLSLRDPSGKACTIRWRRGSCVGIQYAKARL
jgi:PilZ domain